MIDRFENETDEHYEKRKHETLVYRKDSFEFYSNEKIDKDTDPIEASYIEFINKNRNTSLEDILSYDEWQDHINENEKPFVEFVRDYRGKRDFLLIEEFYRATAQHPELRSFSGEFGFSYKGHLFGEDNVGIRVSKNWDLHNFYTEMSVETQNAGLNYILRTDGTTNFGSEYIPMLWHHIDEGEPIEDEKKFVEYAKDFEVIKKASEFYKEVIRKMNTLK